MWNFLYSLIFFISLVLTFFGLKQYAKTSELLRSGIRTNASVIQLLGGFGTGGDSFKPLFEYTDERGEQQTFSSEVASRPSKYVEGDQVEIVYQREGEIKVISFWGLYRWMVILLGLAAPLFVVSGSYLLYTLGILR